MYTPKYWELFLGISCDEAREKVKDYKTGKVTSLVGFIKRHGREKGEFLFKEFQKTSGTATLVKREKGYDFRGASKWCVEYWINQGHTQEEAVECVSKYQLQNAGAHRAIWERKGFSPEEIDTIMEDINGKKSASFTTEYWVEKKGMTEEEAADCIFDRIERMKATSVERGYSVPREDRSAFLKYKDRVYRATNKKDLSSLENIEKREEVIRLIM